MAPSDALPRNRRLCYDGSCNHWGEVTEWFKVLASKASVRETVPWVRIPPSPPHNSIIFIPCSCRFFGRDRASRSRRQPLPGKPVERWHQIRERDTRSASGRKVRLTLSKSAHSFGLFWSPVSSAAFVGSLRIVMIVV